MFDDLFTFEMGLEAVTKARKSQKFPLSAKTKNAGKTQTKVEDIAKVDTALRRKLEKSELANDSLSKELEVIKAKLRLKEKPTKPLELKSDNSKKPDSMLINPKKSIKCFPKMHG